MQWEDFIGQEQIKRELRALILSKSMNSLLLRGKYGYGKTTLANLYGRSFPYYLYYPVPPKDMNFPPYGDVVIVDEIHMAAGREENIFPHMEKRAFVFCTTNTAGLSGALRSRCIELTLAVYTEEELARIIYTTMRRNEINIKYEVAYLIARRSHGNPRIAILLAERIHRLLSMDNRPFTLEGAIEEFSNLGIDADGLDDRHRSYLQLLENAKRPIGLRTISVTLDMDEETIKSEIEPILLQRGAILIGPRGREAIC